MSDERSDGEHGRPALPAHRHRRPDCVSANRHDTP